MVAHLVRGYNAASSANDVDGDPVPVVGGQAQSKEPARLGCARSDWQAGGQRKAAGFQSDLLGMLFPT